MLPIHNLLPTYAGEENNACGNTSVKNEPAVIATMIISI